jgi:histidinol dehydrogenase
MLHKLDNILISHQQPDFVQRLTQCRFEIIRLARFTHASEEHSRVIQIIGDVSQRKDEAVAEYTKLFDGVELKPEEFRISEDDLEKAHKEVDEKLLKSIRGAIKNVRKYQKGIFIGNKSARQGIRYTPIKRVGICVPGASAPLPSTVIMTAVPAQVAGVKEIAVVSPPRYQGSIHPTILAVCRELGIKEVYRIGGVQAVAALAAGTKFVPAVDKIVGPGNQWVQSAKKFMFGDLVGIDSIAGPSEVLIIANDKAKAAWIAADMLSQVEHAPGSASVFTDSQQLAADVLDELKKQVVQLSRAGETVECLLRFCIIAVFENLEKAVSVANGFAPEHLEIQCGTQSRKIAGKIENAGAIFIGDFSPVAVGDYWAGPSHTLPTGRTARFFSALSANDFIKSISIIEYSKKQLAESAEDIIRLAEAEGLDAHAKSVKIRLESPGNS